MDIERRAKSSYMIVVSNETSDSDRKAVKDLIESNDSVLVEPETNTDAVRNTVEQGLRSNESPIIVVLDYQQMSTDIQKFISQYLKGIAEQHVDVPIIVYDDEGGNLGHNNPDLRGRLYNL